MVYATLSGLAGDADIVTTQTAVANAFNIAQHPFSATTEQDLRTDVHVTDLIKCLVLHVMCRLCRHTNWMLTPVLDASG